MAHAGGRPRKYKCVEDMQVLIDKYFEESWDTDNNGRRYMVRPYTVSGLAYALGMDRQMLVDYAARDEFSDTIKNAKRKIEAFAEEQLFTNRNAAGVIFSLKNNYGFRDKSEQTLTVNDITDDLKRARERANQAKKKD